MRDNILQSRYSRILVWISSLVLLLSSTLVSTLLQPQTVQAAEVANRSITLASSQENAETDYTFSFDIPSGAVGAVRIEFCNNNPLPHTTCTNTAVGDDVPQVDGLAGSIATESGTDAFALAGASSCTDPALTAPTNGDRFLEILCNVAEGSVTDATFDGTVVDVDNPENSTSGNPNDTFYARVYVYSDITPPAVANPFTTTEVTHTGGLALSTAEQLTVTARVQEILEFCVGTSTSAGTMPADCSAMTGNSIDMGIVDFNGIKYADDSGGANGEDNKGQVMVRTNAANGVTIGYLAEQAATGTNHLGALRVTGANCNAGDVQTDQCFKSVGTTQDTITAGTEDLKFDRYTYHQLVSRRCLQ